MTKVHLRDKKDRRKLRVKKKVSGTINMPRLSVFRSNKYIYGQLIDDVSGKTLASLSEKKVKDVHEGKSKLDASYEVGKLIAEAALKGNINRCIFDKGSYRYHGRVKNLAQGARDGGLVF